VYKLDPTAGAHADFGSDGILAWGRWNGAVSLTCGGCTPEAYGPNQGFHYVVGMPTPVLPTGGTTPIVYSLIGSTKPTYTDGSAAGTFSGSLNVTFGGIALITGNFNVAMGDGRTFAYTGTGCTSGSVFSMFGTVTSSAGCCSCTSSVGGFFAGASAERAGIAYRFQDDTKTVLGAAAFQKP
jgi:hypothetical protein